MTTVNTFPERPVGSIARDSRGHEWRHGPDGWIGCLTCDPQDDIRWSWGLILDDTYDTTLTVESVIREGPVQGLMCEVRPPNATSVEQVRLPEPAAQYERRTVRRVGSWGRVIVNPFGLELVADGQAVTFISLSVDGVLQWVHEKGER